MGYTSESSIRLWEELTPVPTRKNSIRFITTYAGFEGESKLLWDLYKQVVSKDEHPEGQGERIHPDLPIYANRQARLFAYWDHEPRMPWQTREYYESQRKTLRHNTYLRLHENRWTTGEESFVSAELWDSAVEPMLRPEPTGSLFIGVDAAIKHDCAAIVAVKYSEHDSRLVLADHRIIKPGIEGINLEATVEFYLRRSQYGTEILRILCDPYQMQRSIQTLTEAGLPIEEFNQTLPNLTLATETLLSALTNRNLRLYRADDLRSHVLNAVAVESPRGIRLAKERQSAKIDGCVALSFAVLAATQYGRPLSVSNSPLPVIKSNLKFDVLRLRGHY